MKVTTLIIIVKNGPTDPTSSKPDFSRLANKSPENVLEISLARPGSHYSEVPSLRQPDDTSSTGGKDPDHEEGLPQRESAKTAIFKRPENNTKTEREYRLQSQIRQRPRLQTETT